MAAPCQNRNRVDNEAVEEDEHARNDDLRRDRC